MKRRPRKIEQMVAEHLSAFFGALGLPTVARIPVLGRTGPDIEINAFGLVVDVKSRLQVPTASFPGIGNNETFVWVPLDDLAKLTLPTGAVSEAGKSKIAADYLAHMHIWTTEKYPAWRTEHGEAKYPEKGISMIVMHKAAKKQQAKMPVGQAVCIIYRNDLDSFRERYRMARYLKNIERVSI